MPSSLGMFVYSDLTSTVTSQALLSIVRLDILCMNWVVSLRYVGSFFMIGCRYMSRNSARLAVAKLVVETMGLMPMGVLWIFFRK